MVNIKEVVELLQTDLHSKGIPYIAKIYPANDNLMITCPYHKGGMESTPSCGILLHDKGGSKFHKAGTVHCFTCGATHTLEEMISHVFGKNDKGHYGKEWLLENFNILSTADITFDYTFTIVPTKVEELDFKVYKYDHPYFHKRGLTSGLIDAFDLGYDEFTRTAVIPLFDRAGKCIMLIRRDLEEHRYINSTGGQKTSSLFGLHMVYRKLDKLVDQPYIFIAEGPFDVMKFWQNGYPAVGIMQASLSETQLRLMEQLPFQKIVMATDNDPAGREAAYKIGKRLTQTKEVFVLKYPSGVKDPGDMTKEHFKEMQLIDFASWKKAYEKR